VTADLLVSLADRLLEAGRDSASPVRLPAIADYVPDALDHAVGELARLTAAGSCDQAEALHVIARAASRLAAFHRSSGWSEGVRAARRAPEEDPPAPAAGSWSLSNGMVDVVHADG
jgi:hypothetical protein